MSAAHRTTNTELKAEIAELRREMAEIKTAISEMRTLLDTEAQRCPYREAIARGYNNVQAVREMERRLHDVEVRVAGVAGIAGIVTGVITSLVTHLLTSGTL